jgi:hypothetical protein
VAGRHIGSIFSGFTPSVTQNTFVRVGFVYTDWVRVPVGGAESLGACGGGDEFVNTTCAGDLIVAIKVVCAHSVNKYCVNQRDVRFTICPIVCQNLVALIKGRVQNKLTLPSDKNIFSSQEYSATAMMHAGGQCLCIVTLHKVWVK